MDEVNSSGGRAVDPRQRRLTQLGIAGLAPFVFAALAVWLSPLVLRSPHFALQMQSMALAYGAVIAAYMAGMGAGAIVSPHGPAERRGAYLAPGMIAALAAWLAVWNNWPFDLSMSLAARHALVLLVLIYLLLRDLRAVQSGFFPSWYRPLRIRLTFWASLSIIAIIARLVLWGHY